MEMSGGVGTYLMLYRSLGKVVLRFIGFGGFNRFDVVIENRMLIFGRYSVCEVSCGF